MESGTQVIPSRLQKPQCSKHVLVAQAWQTITEDASGVTDDVAEAEAADEFDGRVEGGESQMSSGPSVGSVCCAAGFSSEMVGVSQALGCACCGAMAWAVDEAG